MKIILMENDDINYDYSQEFDKEELHEKTEDKDYETLEEKLSNIGMNIHNFFIEEC